MKFSALAIIAACYAGNAYAFAPTQVKTVGLQVRCFRLCVVSSFRRKMDEKFLESSGGYARGSHVWPASLTLQLELACCPSSSNVASHCLPQYLSASNILLHTRLLVETSFLVVRMSETCLMPTHLSPPSWFLLCLLRCSLCTTLDQNSLLP